MAYFSKEVPAGVVDGVNKVYTLANGVQQIDDVFVDGAIYLGVITVVGAVITLADAPTATIYVDYWSSAPVPPPPVAFPGLINLTQARQSLLNRKKDLTDVSSTVFIEWCQFVQDFIYRNVKSTDPERFITEYTLNVSSGDATYSLPTGFRDFTDFETGIYKTDSSSGLITPYTLPMTGPGSSTTGFYLSNNTIILTPVPTVDTTYILRYSPTLTRFQFMSDYFTLDTSSNTAATVPSEYMLYVVNALDVMYTIWDEDPGAEGLADARFVRSLNELLNCIRKQPDAYGVQDMSLIF